VRAPTRTPEREIEGFVEKNIDWIQKQRKKQANYIPLTRAELEDFEKRAKKFLPERTKVLAERFGFHYSHVTCRHQKTRWGSCSHKNGISLNIELMRLPQKLRDYIIVHELVHTVHKHHQNAFWNHLERILPGALELDKEMTKWKIGYITNE
jgi:predicted metal-dependent hydrolase